MVRSLGIAAVVVGMAWTGLAAAQSSSPGAGEGRQRFITVREEGKSPQRCLLLKSWREPNGVSAFQVRSLGTGELMTVVGSAPSGSGDPRTMSTRIFHWSSDNKPPEGAPLPPTTALNVPASPPAPLKIAPMPQPTPATLTARQPNLAPTPLPAAPAQHPVVGNMLPPMTPMSIPIIQQKPSTAAQTQPSAPTPPRLTPSPNGTVVSQAPCDCACPQPCETCTQPSCVCCPPSPMRQSFIGRLLKPKTCCPSTEVVCQPTPPAQPTPTKPTETATKPVATPPKAAVVQTPPAKPTSRDPRESWGKVEPWKGPTTPTATLKPNKSKPDVKVTKRVDPTPVPMQISPQPNPLKNPEMYRDLAMNKVPANSKIVVESKPAVAPPSAPASNEAAIPAVPPPTSRSPGRVVELPANEGNAFWTPPPPPKPAPEGPKFNAFERNPNAPPQGNHPALVGMPQLPMPPRGPMQMMPPMPPPPPDTGVPSGMGNAFTLAGTRRPIPADFGGTPQESNGFGDAVPQMQGQGTPPQAYGMPMPAMPRQPMPNRVAMGPPMPMGMNTLMSVPPTQVAPAQAAAARPTGVPQLLTTLKDSLYPSEREWAAEQLSEQNWQTQPQVVQHLIAGAKDDPAATVRAACVHALAQMKAGTNEVTALVQTLKSDRDPRVRHEAEEAMGALGVAGAAPVDSGVVPASHR